MIALLLSVMVGSAVAVVFYSVALLSHQRDQVRTLQRDEIRTAQRDLIVRAINDVRGDEPHEHKVRPVSVVPFAHNAPVAWICPTCSVEVPEPKPLGPVLEGHVVPEAPATATAWDASVMKMLDEASPVRDGWIRERNGSWTQVAQPLTATESILGAAKPLQEIEFEEIRSLDGVVRVRVRP